MNQILFKNALEHYRNQEDLYEEELIKDKRYQFIDDYDGYTFPLNNIDKVGVSSYFTDLSENNVYKMTSIHKLLNLSDLEKVLKNIDSKTFFFLNEILVIINEDDIKTCADYLGREELLEHTLGQNTYDTNSVVINMHEILKSSKDISFNKEDFFYTSVYQFYLTLLHELGHICCRDNLLNKEYSPIKYSGGCDEEELVELFADTWFSYLDNTVDVFKPFNRSFIESKF